MKLQALIFRPLTWLPIKRSGVQRGSAQRGAITAIALGVIVTVAVQLVTGWAIRADRVPLRDPLYLDKFTTLRNHPGFVPNDRNTQLVRVIFIGSSRTQQGINAATMETVLTEELGQRVAAFNFSCPGAGPVTNALYLRRLLAAGVKPDVAVIEVHPVFLAAQTVTPLEARWLSARRLRPEEMPIVHRLGFPVETPGTHGYRGFVLPLYAYRTPMVERYATHFSVNPHALGNLALGDERGFLRSREVSPAERPKLLELAHQQYAEFLPHYQPGGCGLAALRDLLETCRTECIRALLLLTPESTEFRRWYSEPGQSRIIPVLTGLADEFQVPLIDARGWLANELTMDGHHLTGSGADVFTAQLANDVLIPWLKTSEYEGTP